MGRVTNNGHGATYGISINMSWKVAQLSSSLMLTVAEDMLRGAKGNTTMMDSNKQVRVNVLCYRIVEGYKSDFL